MRRMVWILLAAALLATTCSAAEFPGDLLSEAPAGAKGLAGVPFLEGVSLLIETLQGEVFILLRRSLSGAVDVLLVLLLCGAGECLLASVNERTGICLNVAGTAAIVAVTAGELEHLIGLGVETIRELDSFSVMLLPALSAAAASSGMAGAASVRQVVTMVFCDLLITAISELLLPLLYLYIAASAAGAMLADNRLDRVAEGIRKGIIWMLTGTMTVFTLYLSIAVTTAGAADAVSVRVLRRAIAAAVPVVGGVLSGAAETLLAGAGLLKNSIGVFGILTVLLICAVPFLRLAIQYLLYKGIAFAAGTVASPPLTKLIDRLGGAFGLILGMAGSCALLLTVSLLSYLLAVAA